MWHVGAKLQAAFWQQRPALRAASRRAPTTVGWRRPPHGHASRETPRHSYRSAGGVPYPGRQRHTANAPPDARAGSRVQQLGSFSGRAGDWRRRRSGVWLAVALRRGAPLRALLVQLPPAHGGHAPHGTVRTAPPPRTPRAMRMRRCATRDAGAAARHALGLAIAP
eukprot:7161775-Prymnesium_polylepis.1